MTDKKSNRARLLELVDAYCQDALDDAQFAELETTLRDNPAACAAFGIYLQLHANLEERLQGEEAMYDSLPRPSNRIANTARFFTRPTPFSLTVAALVMLLLVATMAFMVPPAYRAITTKDPVEPNDSLGIVAELTGLHEAVWAQGQHASHQGAFLQRGQRMELLRGVALIEFRSGAHVALEGPASFIATDEMHGQLNAGKLTARVPAAAKGFAVATPAAELVDLGTEFGVQVNDDQQSHVVVFDGTIEVTRNEDRGSNTRRLTAGESITVTPGGFQPLATEQPPQFIRAARFATLATGGIVADARRDFRAAPAGASSQTRDGAGIPATSNGAWNYFRSNTLDPGDANAGLELLTYGKAGSTQNAMYRSEGETLGLPAVSARQIFDSPADGAAQGAELAIHPGDAERAYAVVRWTAGDDVPPTLRLRGRVRLLGNAEGTDGIDFALFAAGEKVAEHRIAPADNTGVVFHQVVRLSPGEHVDLVIGRNGRFDNDQAGLIAVISAVESATDPPEPSP